MIRFEEKISYYINRKILVANPEFYVYEDSRIINSMLAAFEIERLTFVDFCEKVDLPCKIGEYSYRDVNLNSNIRPIFSIDKHTDLSCLEFMHYRYIYKKSVIPQYGGLIILCADGKVYEYSSGNLTDCEDENREYIERPILIYGEEVSFSVFKDKESFYGLLDHMNVGYIKNDIESIGFYLNVKATGLEKNEYDLASRVIDDGFILGKRKDLIYYYANNYLRLADDKINSKCYDVFIKDNRNYWRERTYDRCKLKFRYTMEDFFIKGLGICADTASICNVLFNEQFGFKAYILTLRGHNIRHAVCVIPKMNIVISNMSVYKSDSRVGCKSLIYLLSCFHVESIQVQDRIYYNEDFFRNDNELCEFLDYLEHIYCTEFYIYHNIYKKAFSYNIIKKVLGKDTRYIDNKYSIVSVTQDALESIRIFFNNDKLVKLQGSKKLLVYFKDDFQCYEINENRAATINSIVCLDIAAIKQNTVWDSMQVYCDGTVIDEIYNPR